MCGIAGLAGRFVPELMSRMNEVQKHRGPHGRGIYERPEDQVALGHVRLAILDLSDAGRQPMESECGRFVLTFNGEIYNYRELRSQLSARGVSFSSSGDTEVILKGYQLEGVSFFEKLNGMFAFAIWDSQEKELFLVRDRAGIKPLYYHQGKEGELIFASEIKAILELPGFEKEADFEVLVQHLAFCHATTEQTAMKGVSRVAPGSYIKWSSREKKG